jgi:hypothetical protein
MAITENTLLIRQALAYLIELYHELTEENGHSPSAPRTRSSTLFSPVRS